MPIRAVHDWRGVVYGDERAVIAIGREGAIMQSVDGGANWRLVKSSTESTLNAVVHVAWGKFVAVGEKGSLLKSSDGGAEWSSQFAATTADLHQVAFADSLNGFAVGVRSTILTTTNGGESWYIVSSGGEDRYTSVSFADSCLGVIVGKTVFSSAALMVAGLGQGRNTRNSTGTCGGTHSILISIAQNSSIL